MAGTTGAGGGGGSVVDDDATDAAMTPPSMDANSSEAVGRRDTMLATRWTTNVTLQPMKPLGDKFTSTSSQTNSNHTRG
jgi:hypothetical protein